MHSLVQSITTACLVVTLAVPAAAEAVPGAAAAGGEAVSARAPAFTGTITGQVVDRSSQRPLSGVQINIPELRRGALTQENGRFIIPNVPAGRYTIEASSVGFGTVTQEVAVESGGTAVVNFELASRAIALDEVVVTASPASEQRRRAIGTGIASVDVENRLRDAPVTSFNELLQGREPGVVNVSSGGTTGTAGLNVLRGITSLTQDNQPLIYVDGVRLDRSNTTLVGTGGQAISRLVDIPPQDIARIEVIKGSAATAMYGSEASSGVIQIFTKRGRPGETSYDATIKLGANHIPRNLPRQHPDPIYPSANDFLSTGLYQEYTGSVRGATDLFSYFVSGSHTDSEGSFVNNYMKRTTGRINLSFRPAESFTGDVSSSFGYTDVRLPSNDNVTTGILTNMYLGNPMDRGVEWDPWGSAFQPIAIELSRDRNDEAYRYSTGVTLTHRPFTGFSQRMTLGLDYLSGQGTTLTPWFDYPDGRAPAQGGKTIIRRNNLQTNIDYGASLTANLSPSVESQTSVGMQFYTQRDHRSTAAGNRFGAPPLRSLGGTEAASVGESEVRYTTGGLFAQQQIGFDNKLFFIVGGRADGSSAFGENFGFSFFPKASVSYVISDEEWFSLPSFSTLRLRAGFGTAGTQPGAFDKLRVWTTTSGMSQLIGIRPARVGNPDIGPEISREFEGGFDAGLFDDRMTLEFTAYHQQTEDILVDYNFAPSTGIVATQLRNAGTVRNVGFEVSSRLTLMERSGLQWNLNAGYAYNNNEVVDLGGSPSIVLDRFGSRIVEGYPISGKWEFVTVGRNADGFPIASDTAVYIGPSIPPHTGNIGTDVTFGRVAARVNGQFAVGHYVNHHLKPYMGQRRLGVPYFEVLQAAGGDRNAPEVLLFIAENSVYGDFVEPADWFKIREVSLSYELPSRLAGAIGAKGATLSAAGRNLLTFTKYSGVDPEVSATFSNSNNLSVGADFFTVPQSQQFVFGIAARF
jgi:TonB-dependent starch-binding outer membrane protein SusC